MLFYETIKEGFIIEKDGCFLTKNQFRSYSGYSFYKTTTPIMARMFNTKDEAEVVRDKVGGKVIPVKKMQSVYEVE